MGFFKNLANVFVDFEDDSVPATKKDVEIAIKTVRSSEKGKTKRTKKESIKRTDSSALLPVEEVLASKGLPYDSDSNTIYKVEQILDSPQLKGLETKTVKTAVLLNLEMNNIPLEDLILDGKKRIAALNEYEQEQRDNIAELNEKAKERNLAIQQEIDNFLKLKKQEIEKNNVDIEMAEAELEDWIIDKTGEIEGLESLINYFSKK